MSIGYTINICSVNYTKFLGKTIGISPTAICKLVSDNIKQEILLRYVTAMTHCSHNHHCLVCIKYLQCIDM